MNFVPHSTVTTGGVPKNNIRASSLPKKIHSNTSATPSSLDSPFQNELSHFIDHSFSKKKPHRQNGERSKAYLVHKKLVDTGDERLNEIRFNNASQETTNTSPKRIKTSNASEMDETNDGSVDPNGFDFISLETRSTHLLDPLDDFEGSTTSTIKAQVGSLVDLSENGLPSPSKYLDAQSTFTEDLTEVCFP
jgi:hypothetical protein